MKNFKNILKIFICTALIIIGHTTVKSAPETFPAFEFAGSGMYAGMDAGNAPALGYSPQRPADTLYAYTNVSDNAGLSEKKVGIVPLAAGYQFRRNITGIVIGVFAIMFLALVYVLRRYTVYDRQISQIIHDQQTFDLVWGNIKKNSYVSKGAHTFLKKYGFKVPSAKCTLDEMSEALGVDLKKDYFESMRKMEKEGLNILIGDREIISTTNGEKTYYRRYLHRISDCKFMACIQDITEEMIKEFELTQIATTDFLSQLLTRRAMNDLLIKKSRDMRENGGQAYLIMFDIDDFKFINDSFGHDVGDKVLVAVADVIQSAQGCQNTTSRWGGEEFLVLLECENIKIAEERTAKIIADVSERQINFGEKSLTVTVSAGISRFDPHLEYMSSVKLADKAMYKAKRSGKNCLGIL